MKCAHPDCKCEVSTAGAFGKYSQRALSKGRRLARKTVPVRPPGLPLSGGRAAVQRPAPPGVAAPPRGGGLRSPIA